MLRLFRHFVGIIFGTILLLFMIKVHLFEIPYAQTILTAFVFVFLMLLFFLLYRRYFPQKKRKMLLLSFLFVIMLHSNAFSQSVTGYIDQSAYTATTSIGANMNSCSNLNINFCSSAEEYDKQTFQAKNDDWKGDISCENFFSLKVRKCARERLNELKTAPSVFVRQDKLTSKQQKSYHSFTEDSHWNTWVNENFSDITNISEREEMACASFLASLCSEYEERHPPDKAQTVKEIMQNDAKKTSCWPCEMSYIILTVVQALSSQLSDDMRKAGIDLLKILMLLWILYASFQAVLFPSKGMEFIKNLLIRFLCVIVAALILSGSNSLQSFYKNCVTPIISLGLGMTEAIDQAIKTDTTSSFSETVFNQLGTSTSVTNYCSSTLTVSLTGSSAATQLMRVIVPSLITQYAGLQLTENNTVITPELQANLLCLTQRMYRQFSPITAIGQSLISFSFEGGIFMWLFNWPNFKELLVGVLLVVFFSIFSFLVAFKIIDIFLRLGFVLVLMPLFVATAAFPATRSFTTKGFMFFMNIVTEFFGLALAINFITVLFETGIANNKTQLISAMMASYSKDYGENLLTAVTSNQTFYCFFLLIAFFFIGNELLKTSTQIINSIFGTQAIGGSAMSSAVKGAIQSAGQYAKKTWDVSSKLADNAEKYQKPSPSNSSAASSRRYFGQKFGNGINSASQTTASFIDNIGVGTGQFLSKSGIGAIVGVPLTLTSKALSLGVRAVGKTASLGVKGSGRVIGGTAKKIRSFLTRNSGRGP